MDFLRLRAFVSNTEVPIFAYTSALRLVGSGGGLGMMVLKNVNLPKYCVNFLFTKGKSWGHKWSPYTNFSVMVVHSVQCVKNAKMMLGSPVLGANFWQMSTKLLMDELTHERILEKVFMWLIVTYSDEMQAKNL